MGKKEKLDTVLLVVSSLLGFCFIFINAIVGGSEAVLYFIPLLVSVWVMPFYVGYIRGALIMDSFVERIRGWIYLTAGGLLCVLETAFRIAFERTIWPIVTPFQVTILHAVTQGCILAAVIIAGYVVMTQILKISGQKTSYEMDKVILDTWIAALSLTMFLMYAQSIMRSYRLIAWILIARVPELSTGIILMILSTLTIFALFIISERKARYWVKLTHEKRKRNLTKTEAPFLRQLAYISLLVISICVLGYVIYVLLAFPPSAFCLCVKR